MIMRMTKKNTNTEILDIRERVKGIEPSSSAWKADIISHYTTPACRNFLLRKKLWQARLYV